MIKATMKWEGQKVADQVVATAWQQLQAAVVYYHTQLLATLNQANPRPYRTSSRPGEPPKKRTGWLQSHTLYEMDESSKSARVGVAQNAIYGVYLELGTKLMQARPWLEATLRKYLDRISAIAGGR